MLVKRLWCEDRTTEKVVLSSHHLKCYSSILLYGIYLIHQFENNFASNISSKSLYVVKMRSGNSILIYSLALGRSLNLCWFLSLEWKDRYEGIDMLIVWNSYLVQVTFCDSEHIINYLELQYCSNIILMLHNSLFLKMKCAEKDIPWSLRSE